MINDGAEGVLTRFKLKVVTLGQNADGEDITTAIVTDELIGGGKTGGKPEDGNGWPSRTVCKDILAELHAAWVKGAPWCHAQNNPRSARRMIEAKWKTRKGVATKILDSWMANGIIEHDERDPKRHVCGYRKVTDI